MNRVDRYADERFRETIDRHGEGRTAFMSAAVEVYCANNATE